MKKPTPQSLSSADICANPDSLVSSMPPMTAASARILVLGTMPGVASLKAQAYYAHPRNAFWPIIVALHRHSAPDYASVTNLSSADRLELLKSLNIAVWDVLAHCDRPGSLDSAIRRESEVANPLLDFIQQHRQLELIAFNGKLAARLFARHISPSLDPWLIQSGRALQQHTLPSSSPAMASLTLGQKYHAWQAALDLH